MTQETEALIASDEDLTKLFAGKPTQYRKSKSLPKFTGEAMRACAKINRIFFDDPDEAYRLFHELVPDAGEGVQFTPPFNVDYGIAGNEERSGVGSGSFLPGRNPRRCRPASRHGRGAYRHADHIFGGFG